MENKTNYREGSTQRKTEDTYMGVQLKLLADGWAAPTLNLYRFDKISDMKPYIQDKLNNKGFSSRGVQETYKASEYISFLLEEEINLTLSERFNDLFTESCDEDDEDDSMGEDKPSKEKRDRKKSKHKNEVKIEINTGDKSEV